VLDRIQCLTLSAWHLFFFVFLQEWSTFEHLQQLELTGGHASSIDLGLLMQQQFPVLQSLHWPSLRFGVRCKSSSTFADFIPLQHIFLGLDHEFQWVLLLQACVATLNGLEIRGNVNEIEPVITVGTVTLPVLQFLHLNYDLWRGYTGLPFKLVTPALTCVEMGS